MFVLREVVESMGRKEGRGGLIGFREHYLAETAGYREGLLLRRSETVLAAGREEIQLFVRLFFVHA